MRLALCVLSAALIAGASQASMYGAKSAVVELTPENFHKTVTKSEDLWLVEFYAPWCGHCKNLAPEWEKAAKKLAETNKNIHIAAVDADKHSSLGNQFGIQGFPTIKVFGVSKGTPTDYNGPRNAAGIVSFATTHWRRIENKRKGIEEEVEEPKPASEFYDGSDVTELTDASFDTLVANGNEPWLVEFYAPWCGHCKNLAPEWKKAATLLAGSIRVGAIDATQHKKWSAKYGVRGFPTIKFIPPGSPNNAEDYEGSRSAEGIAQYGMLKAELYPAGPVVVEQIADQAMLLNISKGKRLTVVFVVPHVIDTGAAGRKKLIDMFGTVAAKLRGRVAFGWIVGGEHEAFEKAFNLHATYPTFIAYNVAKNRGTTYKGAFAGPNILDALRKLLDGKIAVSALDAPATLSSNVPLWDGNDYVPPAEDE